MSLAKEFKEFISRGNVVDLAVGVIIGGAFGAIVTSLVKDVVMPPVSYLMSGGDVSSWKYTIHDAVMVHNPDPKFKDDLTAMIIGKPEVALAYGNFLQATLNFLIIAAILFVFIVKFLGWIMHLKKQEIVAPPPPTKDQELLTEIRDLLKQQVKPT